MTALSDNISTRTLLRLSYPALIDSFSFVLIGVLDCWILGRVSVSAVAGVGVANTFIMLVGMAAFSVAYGGSDVVAQHVGGKASRKNLREIYAGILLVETLIGVVSIGLVVFGANAVLKMFGLEMGLFGPSLIYLKVAGLALLPRTFSMGICAILRGLGKTQYLAWNALLINALHAVLSYVLALGFFGVPAYGVLGAALGVLVATCVGLGYVLFCFYKETQFEFSGLTWARVLRAVRLVLSFGVPHSMGPLSFHGSQVVLQFLLVRLGAASMAARNYAASVLCVIDAPASALACGTGIMVGHLVGANRFPTAKAQVLTGLKYSFGITLLVGVILVLAMSHVSSIFTTDQEVGGLLVLSLLFGILLSLIKSVNFAIGSGLYAAGDVRFPSILGVCSMWLVMVPAAYFLMGPAGLGLKGYWLALLLDEAFRMIIQSVRYASGAWQGFRIAIEPSVEEV